MKNLEQILPLFPKDAVYYFCKPDIPAIGVEILKEKHRISIWKGKHIIPVSNAYQTAKKKPGKNDLIYVVEAPFVVARNFIKFFFKYVCNIKR